MKKEENTSIEKVTLTKEDIKKIINTLRVVNLIFAITHTVISTIITNKIDSLRKDHLDEK